MRRLFHEDQIHGFISEKPTHHSADDDHFLAPQNTVGTVEPDADDYDVMFANPDDPIVGSYSEVGRFTNESDYLIYAD